MKTFKKSLALLLCLSMIMSLFVGIGSFTASAAKVTTFNSVTLSNMKLSTAKRNSILFDNATVTDDGALNVAIPDTAPTLKIDNTGSYYNASYLTLVKTGSSAELLQCGSSSTASSTGQSLAVRIKYRVKTIGSSGYAKLGFGHVEALSNSSKPVYVSSIGEEITVAGDEEYEFVGSTRINKNKRGEYRIFFDGQGSEIEILSISYAQKTNSFNYGLVVYHIGNDYIYPMLCNEESIIYTGFPDKDDVTVSTWYDEDNNVTTGTLMSLSSYTALADLHLYAHKYDNDCDTDCNLCGATRDITHTYDYDCDTDCNICGEVRTAGSHVDSDDNDLCDNCGKSLATIQEFDQTVSLAAIKTTSNMKRGSYIYDGATYTDGVLNVPVTDANHLQLVAGQSNNIKAYLTAIPASSKPQQSSSGRTRAIWVKYKVKSIGEGGYAQVGIGYTSTYANNWTATNIVSVDKKIKEAGETEYSFAASIPYNGDQEYRLVFSGYGDVEYEITSIKWATVTSLKYGVVRYHIGNDFMYPVFGYNIKPKTSGFESLGADKDTVSVWYDANDNETTGRFICPSADLTESADIDVYDTILPKVIVDCDFESSTTLSDLNIDANDVNKGNAWTVVEGEDGNYLQRTASKDITDTYNCWGFMFKNTTLVAGRTYKVSFKAMADKAVTLDYGILTASRYYSSNNDAENVFANDHNKVALAANEWTEIESYFTAKSYDGGTNALFQILTTYANDITVSFDDIIIEEVYGMSYNEYGNKYATPHICDLDGDMASIPNDPEREGYIFGGWYVNDTLVTAETEVSNFMQATAQWTEAVTTKEDIAEITTTGIHDLGIKVTNANAYPIKFSLVTDGEVTVSIFTASADDATVSQSVVWTRTFERGGDVGALINPATIKVDGVVGNELYIALETADGVTASISGFVIGNAPTTRLVEGDVNGDNTVDIRDLVSLKNMAADTNVMTWLGDYDGDGYIAGTNDLVAITKSFLNVSDIVTEKLDRTLVWNEEFDGAALDTTKFGYSYYSDRTNSTSAENISVSDGKLNLNVTKTNGIDFATAPRLVTDGKMSYKYGYLEVRAKMSCSPSQWASIWLGGEGEDIHGEIDIVETTDAGGGFRPNIHAWDDSGERLAQYSNKISYYTYADHNFNKTEYHTFGFEWDETSLKFYVDGFMYQELLIADIEGTEYEDGFVFNGLLDQFYSVRLSQTFYIDSLTYDDVMPEFNIDYVRLYQKAGEQLKINGELVEK